MHAAAKQPAIVASPLQGALTKPGAAIRHCTRQQPEAARCKSQQPRATSRYGKISRYRGIYWWLHNRSDRRGSRLNLSSRSGSSLVFGLLRL
ncbi:hypothetical protein Acr_10g0008930 [Actinidia rufa]|uniref:Uncharacterized protein n=1 Tax=Actinidia rufa TaxID=165716 RepID=A0A7J0F9Z0_9ERIC|nr:hypothetical protein Acr_10g0008930 [Actinidia rufa]